MMYAIIEVAGQQFKVQQGAEICVHRLPEEPGNQVEFSEVLLLDDEGNVKVGTPFVKNFLIKAKVVEHVRGDKVVVFHKKRRKGYQKATGHRQDFTKILIESIGEGTKTVKKAEPAKKAEAPKKEEPVAKKETASAQEKPEPKKEKAEPKKETVKKETVTEKPAAKKPAAKKAAEKKEPAEKASEEKKSTKKEAPKPENKEDK